jgi:Cys-tRNA(Pro)/Cys-tRNA(Cys) deacylase
MIRTFIVGHIHGLVNEWQGTTQKVLRKTAWLDRLPLLQCPLAWLPYSPEGLTCVYQATGVPPGIQQCVTHDRIIYAHGSPRSTLIGNVMAKKLHSLRFLETLGIAYEEYRFPETVQSASDVAEHLGIPVTQVYKTLVVLPLYGKPLLVMIPGNRQLHLKPLAHTLGEKKLRLATQKEAEALTGLKVGGISALALRHKNFQVYLDRTAERLEHILVSAGRRGIDVRLSVTDLVHATRAIFVEAT